MLHRCARWLLSAMVLWGPGLCCCAFEPSTDDEANHPASCCHSNPKASDHDDSPAEPSSHHECGCQHDFNASEAVSPVVVAGALPAPVVDDRAADALVVLARLTPVARGSPIFESTAFPYANGTEILRALHILRC